MAKALARALMGPSASQTPSGFVGTLNGQEGLIVWADGHVLQLAEPEDYDPRWKVWNLEDLPIFPPRFQFRRMPVDSGKLKMIEDGLRRAKTIVNACDAAREGELIFDEIADWCGLYKRNAVILRMWISDTTPAGLRTAFGFMKSHTDKALVRLREQARVRAECDQLWGFNLTRYATLALRDKLTLKAKYISIGRVRSPLVALVADRCRAVVMHQPEPFWRGKMTFRNEYGETCEAHLMATPEDQFGIRDMDWKSQYALEERIRHARSMMVDTWTVIEGDNKDVKEYAPPLFDLTNLQRTANRLWGWSAKWTERVAQRLYERYNAISYPRTDCDKLPASMEADVMRLWHDFYHRWLPSEFPEETEKLPTYEPEVGANFAEKISDHYAIIPTSIKSPPPLDANNNMSPEYQLWQLIVMRFITAWLPPAVIYKSSRVFTMDYLPGELLRAVVKAAPVKEAGWLKFEDVLGTTRGYGQKLADRMMVKVMPEMNGQAHLIDARIQLYKTTPPEYYSYDMLLAAMVENGLGTPATRGQQIQESIDLHYLFEDNFGRLQITEDGEQVIQILRTAGAKELLDPKLTQFWEKQFEQVGKGGEKGRTRLDVLEDIVLQIEDLGARLIAPELVKDIVFCPKTGLLVEEHEKGWRFPGWKEIICPRQIMGRKMKASEYRDIFMSKKKGAGPYEGFFSQKSNKHFRCWLRFNSSSNRFEPVFKAR